MILSETNVCSRVKILGVLWKWSTGWLEDVMMLDWAQGGKAQFRVIKDCECPKKSINH